MDAPVCGIEEDIRYIAHQLQNAGPSLRFVREARCLLQSMLGKNKVVLCASGGHVSRPCRVLRTNTGNRFPSVPLRLQEYHCKLCQEAVGRGSAPFIASASDYY